MSAADASRVIAAARGWIGTPYHDQASLKGVGTDCLGLARAVWREVVGPEPATVPAYTRDWGEVGGREVLAEGANAWLLPIPVRAAGPGSVVLFRMARGAIAKHIGILTEAQTFVHAYQAVGVIEEPLTQAWARRIAFAYLYPSGQG